MPTIESVADGMAVELQNVPKELVMKEILNTARDFFQKSKSWHVPCFYILMAGMRDFFVRPSKTGDLVKVDFLDMGGGAYITDVSIIDRRSCKCMLLRDYDISHVSQNGGGTCAIMPTETATTLDDDVYPLWADAIRYGTLAKIRSLAGREWYEPNLSVFYRQQYEGEIGRAVRGDAERYRKSPAKFKGGWL